MNRRTGHMLQGLYLLVWFSSAQAGPKPDFSGIWKLNLAKSRLQMAQPDSSVFNINCVCHQATTPLTGTPLPGAASESGPAHAISCRVVVVLVLLLVLLASRPTLAQSNDAEEPVAVSETSEAPPAEPSESGAERTVLNLLGEVDASSGESRRNENVDITLVDNNVLKELNVRMGPTATIVQEFEVDKRYFGAEFGGPPRTQIHLASPRAAGFHGAAYLTHGNSVFAARSFFQVGGVKPARENDYGFNVGVGLWKGANFAIDASQRRTRGNVNGNVLVPTLDERTPLTTDPQLRLIVSSILDSYPAIAPNRTDINERALNTNAPQSIDNDAFGARFDQALGDFDRLALRYQFRTQNVDAFQLVEGQNPNTTTRAHDARLTWTRILSATSTVDFSAGFDRVTSLIVADETALGPLIWTGRELETLGGTTSIPFDRALNSYRYAGLLRHVRGRHLLTTGFELVRGQVNGTESSRHSGLLSFHSDFTDEMGRERDTITNLRLGAPSSFTLGIGNTHRGFRDWRAQFFVGDDWRVTSGLAFNLGLRYLPITRPTEVNRMNEIPYSSDWNNFAPHFGFSSRIGPRAGVLRGSYGMQYGEIFVATYTQARLNPPLNRTVSVTAPDLRDPFAGVDLGVSDPNARSNLYELSPDLATPYSHQYNFSWELRPARRWTLLLGYVGSRSHRLLATWFFNRARDVPGIALETSTINDRRPDERYYEQRRILNGSRGYYDAAKATLVVQAWHGLSMDASYWFSKAIDLGSHYASTASNTDSFRGRSQTELDVHGDVKALSDFHQPHSSMIRLTCQTPRVGGASRLNSVVGQWEIFSVVLAKMGTPFTVTSGSDSPGAGNVDGLSGDRPHVIDPSFLGSSIDHPDTAPQRLPKSAFGFITAGEQAGNLGRNTFRKDGIRNVNFAISRNWVIAAEKTLTFRAESINLFNSPQFAEPGASLTADNFGQITNTLNDGRTHRFFLQLTF